MARGFLAGALWGTVLSVGVAGTASVIAPSVQPPEVGDSAPGAVATPAVQPSPTGAAPQTPAADAPPQIVSPELTPDPGETGDSMTGVADNSAPPAEAPVASTPAVPDAPATAPDSARVTVEAEEPVLPNPQALAPMAPPETDDVAINTDPAAPPPTPEPADPAPAPLTAEAPPPDPAPQDSPPAPQVTAEADPTPSVPEPPSAVVPPAAESAPEQPPATAEAEPESPQVAILTPKGQSRIGTPAGSLTDRDSAVVVNRPSSDAATSEAGTDATPAPSGTDARPVVRNAEAFTNTEDKPLMSIVLIDDGSGPASGATGIAALRSFPYPLSFAVDSGLPDALERVALYRSEGFEVLAMIDMPPGATASDAETTLGVLLPEMEGVGGVLEGTGQGFQDSRGLSDQVTAILAQSGHGLVTQDNGLNTMPKLARKEGVPADPVFRDFDSNGQSATVIRRFLDQAAFKAGQEGAVIMLGRLRPDTISALLLWGLQDRASSVALAPVSAVLLREPE